MTKLKLIWSAMGLVLLMTALTACEKKPVYPKEEENPADKKYGAMIMLGAWPNTSYYILELASLKEGKADLNGHGVNVTTIVQDQGMIQRGGNYYYHNTQSGRLGKYHISNDRLITDKEVPFNQIASVSSHLWINDETLLLFGVNGDQNELQYAEVKVDGLQVSGGTIPIPASPDEEHKKLGIGFAEFRDGKIFLGYGYGGEWPSTPLPKVLVAVIDYPSMELSKTLEDSRSKWPGAPTRYTPSSFVDEKNDIYFATSPDNGWDYDAGSVLYRIKSNSDELDANYFFDFSSKANGHTVQAMWYIGNGEAIVRARIPSDRTKPDFYYKWDSYFVIVNVSKGEVVKKLDLSTDIGEVFVQAVVVENEKAYIMLNDADKKGYMWEYDPANGKLTKGLEFAEGYDYLLRIDKWK